MNFKTSKGEYKLTRIDRANGYARNIETRQEIVFKMEEFNRWVNSGQITRLPNVDETLIDKSRFKVSKT